MKNSILILVLLVSAIGTSNAQLENSKWKGIVYAPEATEAFMEFRKDTLHVISTNGMPLETMNYALSGDTLSIRKITGGSPCDVSTVGYYKTEIFDNKLFIIPIKDDCLERTLAFDEDAWIKEETLMLEDTKIDPTTLVQQQLDAYNARDTEAFLAPYADDIELYRFPNTLLSKGKDAMREQYEGMFAQLQNLHCEVPQRIVLGNTVIDKEIVTGIAETTIEAIAIYTIENRKIKQVYFIQ